MKSHLSTTAILSTLMALATAPIITARPTDFSEVSLWVRARETDKSIVQEVSQRKLVRALTPQQEATLKSQGASDSLVQSLRSPNVIASPAEVAASEVRSQPPRVTQSQETASDSAADSLQIFEVSAGHPINLNQWGGPDYEFAFNIWRFAGEDITETAVVDTVRTYTDVATYIGPLDPGSPTTQPCFRSNRFTPYLGGDLKDNSYITAGYTSAVSHSTSRGISIDKRNPVFIKGVPYTLYPIYGVRGVSLYYIGSSSNSVKLAVNTSSR
jgi:hypothetical protein